MILWLERVPTQARKVLDILVFSNSCSKQVSSITIMGACMTGNGNRAKRSGPVWLMQAGAISGCNIHPRQYLLLAYVRLLTPQSGIDTSLGFAELLLMPEKPESFNGRSLPNLSFSY